MISRFTSAAAVCALALAGATVPAHAMSAAPTLKVWVSPAIMTHNAHPILHAQTAPGASCIASVTYNDGRHPTSFRRYVGRFFEAPASGTLTWSWHEQTVSNGGVATVTCTFQGKSVAGSAVFTVQ